MRAGLIADVRSIWHHLPEFGAAAVVSLCLAAAATPIAFALGILLVLGRLSPSRVVRAISTGYVELFRNVPGLIVIYFVFFLLPLLGTPLSPFVSAVVALGAQHGAYFCEIFRGALASLSQRQAEAGRALGMRHVQVMRWVILPQVFRDALPPMANEVVLLLLNTAVASTIGVRELTQTGNTVGEATAAIFPVYGFVALIYLAMTVAASGTLRWMEHTWRVRR